MLNPFRSSIYTVARVLLIEVIRTFTAFTQVFSAAIFSHFYHLSMSCYPRLEVREHEAAGQQ